MMQNTEHKFSNEDLNWSTGIEIIFHKTNVKKIQTLQPQSDST